MTLALDIFFKEDVRDHLAAIAAMGGDRRTLQAIALSFGVTLGDVGQVIEGPARVLSPGGDGEDLAQLDVNRFVWEHNQTPGLR